MTSLKDRLPTRIVTTRLVLATPAAADIPAIARHCNNANLHRWMSRLPFPYREADARFFVEEIVPGPEEYCLAIHHQDELVGVVGLHLVDGLAPELGYWLGEPHWGHGFATEAARAIVDAARAAGVARLRSRALAENTASRHVLEKTGFIQTGTITEAGGNLEGREMVTFALEFGDD